jgi:hypothetical protein
MFKSNAQKAVDDLRAATARLEQVRADRGNIILRAQQAAGPAPDYNGYRPCDDEGDAQQAECLLAVADAQARVDATSSDGNSLQAALRQGLENLETQLAAVVARRSQP